MSWTTPDHSVERRVARYFPAAYDAAVDATHFPVYVTVTLQVVIEIDEPEDDVSCRDRTTMAWRILP